MHTHPSDHAKHERVVRTKKRKKEQLVREGGAQLKLFVDDLTRFALHLHTRPPLRKQVNGVDVAG